MEEGYRQREFHASLQRLRARSRERRDAADAQQTRAHVTTRQPSAADHQLAVAGGGSAEAASRDGGHPGHLQLPDLCGQSAETRESNDDDDDVPQDDELAGGDGRRRLLRRGGDEFHEEDPDDGLHLSDEPEEEGPMGFMETVTHLEYILSYMDEIIEFGLRRLREDGDITEQQIYDYEAEYEAAEDDGWLLDDPPPPESDQPYSSFGGTLPLPRWSPVSRNKDTADHRRQGTTTTSALFA